MSLLGSSACSSPSGTLHILSQLVTLATERGFVTSSHLFSRYVDGFFQKMPAQPQPFPAALMEQEGTAPVPPRIPPPPQHSGPSPVRIQAIDLVSLHPGIAWDPPLRTLSSQPSMWASSSWPHPCPSSPSSHSLTRSAHKCQQKTVAFSISSSIVQHLSN